MRWQRAAAALETEGSSILKKMLESPEPWESHSSLPSSSSILTFLTMA